MRLLKKMLSVLTAVVVVLSFSVISVANDNLSNDSNVTLYTRLDYLLKAYKEIELYIKSGTATGWSGNNVNIYGEIPLYSVNGNIIGYEFAISESGKEMGFISIADCGYGPQLAKAQFEGLPDYLMLKDFIDEYSTDGKIYYIGNIYNYIKTENGYVDLGWSAVFDDWHILSQTEMENCFEAYCSQVDSMVASYNENAGENVQNYPQSVVNLNSSVSNFRWLKYSDFSSLYITDVNGVVKRMINSCTPIAATNIVKYFCSQNSGLLSNSGTIDSDIFVTMYIEMNTNDYWGTTANGFGGTRVVNIKSGFEDACNSLLNSSPTTAEFGSSSHLTPISDTTVLTDKLDNGHLIIASIDGDSTYGTHSVAIVSHNGSTFQMADGLNERYIVPLAVTAYVYHAVSVKF